VWPACPGSDVSRSAASSAARIHGPDSPLHTLQPPTPATVRYNEGGELWLSGSSVTRDLMGGEAAQPVAVLRVVHVTDLNCAFSWVLC